VLGRKKKKSKILKDFIYIYKDGKKKRKKENLSSNNSIRKFLIV